MPPKKPKTTGTPAPVTPALPNGGSAKTKYQIAQEDELTVLESIYGDDFKLLDVGPGAWHKSEPAFQVTLKSTIDDKVYAVLRVTFGATYPRSPPLMTLVHNENLRSTTVTNLRNVMETLPKELANQDDPQAMMYEVFNTMRDVLDSEADVRAAEENMPSLEDERAYHAAAAAELQLRQDEEAKKEVERQAEESARLELEWAQQMKDLESTKAEELRRIRNPPALTKELTMEEDPAEFRERVLFDRPISIMDDAGYPRMFQAVTDKTLIRQSTISTVYTVKPVVRALAVGKGCPMLVLKETKIERSDRDIQFKAAVRMLEGDLENLKAISHPNILQVFDYHVKQTLDGTGASDFLWTASVLMEFANKGSLEEFLEMATEGVPSSKARSWAIELLHALGYLHDNNLVHGSLHAGNILLVRSADGDIKAKLADSGYQRHLHNLKIAPDAQSMTIAKSLNWIAPEIVGLSAPLYTTKSDIWDFGGILLEMVFGPSIFEKYASPHRLMDAMSLTDSFRELLKQLYTKEPSRRSRTSDVIPSEWFATDAPVIIQDRDSTSSYMPPTPARTRRESTNTLMPAKSRYEADFVDQSRLGKGAFGEVLKARKKLDGQWYAIKTIVQKSSASLTIILKEVRFLSTLNHPYVVRYYNTWTEEVLVKGPDIDSDSEFDTDSSGSSNALTEQDNNTDDSGDDDAGGPDSLFDESTGGLDFISNSRLRITFGDSSGSEDEEEDNAQSEDDQTTNDARSGSASDQKHSVPHIMRPRSDTRELKTTRTILYIQMEYCERNTLRDLIRKDLYKDTDTVWKLFRQILEGMAHIHELNVVHRDLKPENLFISTAGAIKIGDFGLATSAQYASFEKSFNGARSNHDMTASVGTANYIAPEVRSTQGTYNSKIDMYSLGIIFFEMNYPPMGGSERIHVLGQLRQSNPQLPADFQIEERRMQADIILSLLDHKPKNRPTSSALLKSGKLPVQMESETIQQAVAAMADPTSAYYQAVLDAFASRIPTTAEELAWDAGISSLSVGEAVLRGTVKDQLEVIFRRHGALEVNRQLIFPRSKYYDSAAVQLLDRTGVPVQLCFDLTVPHARAIARNAPTFHKSYTFGDVFRDRAGSQPTSVGEVDFDIVSDGLDLAFQEAEVIKVLDEIVTEFPSFATKRMCFNLNHSDMLHLIFDFCGINMRSRGKVVECLGKLNIHQFDWFKIREELRAPSIGVSATSLDDLERFNLRQTPIKAFETIKNIMEGSNYYEKAIPTIAHINQVIAYLNTLNVRTKIYVTPLSCLREKFCKDGLTFSCVSEYKERDMFAAGGRYDSLVREYRPYAGSTSGDRHAVGFSLAWKGLVSYMTKYIKDGEGTGKKSLKKANNHDDRVRWIGRRCDILIASLDTEILRTTGVDLLQILWAHDYRAELAPDARTTEELISKFSDDPHCWIIVIKQDSVLKIKSMAHADSQDVDIPMTHVLPWLREAFNMRDRELREGTNERGRLHRQHSQHAANDPFMNHEQVVSVVVNESKVKKNRRLQIVDQAQARAAAEMRSFLKDEIVAVDTSDKVTDMLRTTKISNEDSWREVIQKALPNERSYIMEVYEHLKKTAAKSIDAEGASGNVFIYNSRTGRCFHYDLTS